MRFMEHATLVRIDEELKDKPAKSSSNRLVIYAALEQSETERTQIAL